MRAVLLSWSHDENVPRPMLLAVQRDHESRRRIYGAVPVPLYRDRLYVCQLDQLYLSAIKTNLSLSPLTILLSYVNWGWAYAHALFTREFLTFSQGQPHVL